MKAVLLSLPDAKFVQKLPPVTVGAVYKVQKEIGNGYVVETDDGKDLALILASRFAKVEE